MNLFDPVIDMARKNQTNDKDTFEGPIFACFHCYRPIKGKVYFYDDKPFDKFCYQFRYVIDIVEEDEEEKRKLLEKALARDREKGDSK
jgi:hypothetical protein